MKVTFLGTNGWYDTLTGNTCSVLVETDDYDLILDAGNGIAKADRYISQDRPTFLFISHYHIDHIAGLHTLVKFRFSRPLSICGQPGIGSVLPSFVREPFTVPLEKLSFPVKFIEMDEGLHEIPFRVECRLLVHPIPCYGYRILIDGKVIAFCTDTGFCENAIRLARDADLLITECGLRPGEESPAWPHLNPGDAIRIAEEAHAKRLALMHFSADLYPTLEDRSRVQRMYESRFPGLICATDDLSLEIR